MKLISQGSATLNLTSEVDIPLDGTGTLHENISTTTGQEIRVSARFAGVIAGNTLTYKIKIGGGSASAKTNVVLSGSFVVAAGEVNAPWQSESILMGFVDTDFDTMKISFESDNAGGDDDSVAVTTIVWDMNTTDSAGNVGVGNFLGTTVSLTNDNLDVNVAEVGGNTPAVPPDNWSDMGISTDGDVNTNLRNNEAYGPNNEATG